MHTSGEKVRMSDEAERVQSVSYSQIRCPEIQCGQAVVSTTGSKK